MSNEALFIKATREKMRFPYKGMVSVEDLWQMPMTELDKIYKTLNGEAKKAHEESLLEIKTIEDETLAAQIEIVKYIFTVKQEEKKAAETAKERKEMKQRLLEIKAAREDKKLEGLSDADLDKMLGELG